MDDFVNRSDVLALLATRKPKVTYRGKFEPSHKSPQSAAVMEERKRLADAVSAIPRADLAQAPAPVRVKDLQWSGQYYPIASPESYQIWSDNGGSGAPDDPREAFDGFMLYSPHMMVLGLHPTLEAAKAAAQADYDARILAVLEPDAGVVAELVEALRDLLAAYSKPDERICCNGQDCGCQGATAQMMAEHYAKEALAKWDAK